MSSTASLKPMMEGLLCIVMLAIWCALWLFLLSKRRRIRQIRRVLLRTATAALIAALLGICVISVKGAFEDFGPLVSATAGNGTKGKFTADQLYGSTGKGSRRTWQGRFVSDDATIVRDRVYLEGAPPDMALQRPVPALDTGAPGVVYGTLSLLAVADRIFTIILVSAIWSTAAWFLVSWLNQRRKARAAAHGSASIE